jgi:hypothetical protein
VKKRTTVWLPEALVARLKKLSRKTGAPMAEIEADVARTWKLDPVLSQKNFGTNQVHLVKGPVN